MTQPRQRPADIWTRLNEISGEAADNVQRQHVVSQATLREFTGSWPGRSGRLLASMNLDFPNASPRPAGTSKSGFVPDFLRYASRSAEQVWQETETRLPAATRAAADGSLFGRPDLVKVIRDAIALHFVRSHQTSMMHEGAWSTVRRQARDQWLCNEQVLEQAFLKKYGLHLPSRSRGALELMADELLRPMDALFESGALLRIRIEHLFAEAKRIADGTGLEIARPIVGEFLIGDTPALAVRIGHDGIGPTGGVPLGDADQVVFPLGPHLLASLGPRNAYGAIPAQLVDAFNGLQVRAAQRHVYFRPGSGLERTVRRAARRRSGAEPASQHNEGDATS
ncbi:hypothetical protein GCM10009557_44480 [Virgisporangium ochraceum]|uniref:DUF4238 domain-containing protein n=1 Tax=Virgisporangium ochraceum TaxID=65505 RepID=A0A8J3ZUY8_9ACTN|nr:DUF4238 domain-containing protein [Virgisporangium ochraceum]GIJ70409.1 hypothetical protein Voc01_053260 [Virgisporangium ochraceum]